MPQSSNERTELISDAIRSQAEQQASALIDKATQYREQEIASLKQELNLQGIEEYRNALNRAQQDAVMNVSHAEQDSMQALLRHRQALEEEIFSQVHSRLLAYAQTEEYKRALLTLLLDLKEQYRHASSIISLREQDMALAPQIQALLPGCTVKADRHIRLGGFTLENTETRSYIDETLETRLSRQREWYLETSHLKVKE